MSEIEVTSIGLEEAVARLEELSLRMCGGASLDEYVEEFRARGQSQCTNVWAKGIIAYRCRSCQMNDSSAICVDCFQNGHHWEHDYVMYHSESGGCCDCGDRAAWKESGFCTAHQCVDVPEAEVKEELLGPTHVAVQYVLRELVAWVKKISDNQSGQQGCSQQETDMQVAMATIYFDWSQKVCAVDALRNIVCEDIIECEFLYQTDTSASSLEVLLHCLGWMPEKLIEAETTLFLQLLYKNAFKDKFLDRLRGKYEEMVTLAVDTEAYMKNYKSLDTNLDRVMVQLFNDPEMTTRLIHKYNLLELFIGVFSKVVSCAANNETAVVDVEHEAIKNKVYLRPQGDLRLIIAHGDIAVHLLTKQPELFPNFLEVLVKLQWMNSYYPKDEDIEFENSWTLAIQLEMNSMAIICQLISRCSQDCSAKQTLVTAATYTLKVLKQYLNQDKHIAEGGESGDKIVSLHIPLHRTFSAILQRLVLLPWDIEERGFLTGLKEKVDFKFTEDEILRLMDHPLRISVWMAEIRAQMWRKSSEEFSRLELIYRGSFWHDQSMDMDILLLQFCTIACEDFQAKVFVKISEGFNFKKEVTTRTVPERSRRLAEICLLQDFIKLILLIVRERRNLGRTEEDEAQDTCLEYDIIQWLCVRDQTYSQLCRALSAIPMDHQKLNTLLDKVAIYHEPKVADRGYYQLKPEYWKHFDPLFAHFYLNELEDAEDRAVKVGKLEHYWRIKAPPAASAPYDRLSGLLHTKACHFFLLNVLDEVRFLVGVETTATAGEALGVTALQMMAVLVSDSRNNIRNSSHTDLPTGPVDEFPTEDITVNIHVRIRTSDGTNRSIYDMLQVLVLFNQCTRLVDSVNHVLELLCLSANEKTRAFEVDSQGAEDMQRRLRKEQRQKAILEEFAAKRKAFMETQNVSDDEGSEDGSEMEGSNIAEKFSSCKSGALSVSETLTKAGIPGAEGDYVAMETFSESKECVLCKRKRDGKNSSPCWIALVQRYKFPYQVLKSGDAVKKTSENGVVSNFHQSEAVMPIDDDLDQLVTVGRLAGSEEASAIDFCTVQHVQCCGHQMHYDCFQGHMKTLQLSHDAGKGVVDPGKAEFLCPTCRRLANVLLPDVDASLSSKKHDMHDNGKGVEETENERSRFWQSNKNLESAIDSFCCQVLRVGEQSPQSFLSPPSRFRISQALWEGLVLNVVHCEVETREGVVKTERASSSSAPIKPSDECTWGGNPSHWIALRELGRLAMLSNTLPGAVQERSGRLQMLCKSLRLVGRRENLARSAACTESSPVQDGMSELETIIHEIFPQTPSDLVESSDLLELTDASFGSSHIQDETVILVESPGSTSLSTLEDREEERAYKNITPNYDSQREESKDSYILDSKYGVSRHHALAAPDPIAPDRQQRYEITFEDAEFEGRMSEGNMMNVIDSSQLSSPEQDRSILPKEQSKDTWIFDILRNGIFTADPFRLLSLLLIIFNGQPDRRSLHLMVKFAYTIAVLQTQIAVTRLDVEGPEVESFVQRACLPFLRRAAMLVQIITRDDFRGQHGLSGINVMEFLDLQRALELPDCAQILQPQVHGARATLATQLLHLHDPVSKSFTFELRKVPRKAQLYKPPRVFQVLLLENIHNKKTCGFCGEMPVDPAICLLCGMLLCCGSDCCKRNGIGECSRHAAEESAGVGIFLLLRSTQLLLIRNNRTCMGLSLYLDVHGEEDLYLRRSQLLYLSDLRLNEVRRLWMTAAFDYDSYILRNSQSKPNVY